MPGVPTDALYCKSYFIFKLYLVTPSSSMWHHFLTLWVIGIALCYQDDEPDPYFLDGSISQDQEVVCPPCPSPDTNCDVTNVCPDKDSLECPPPKPCPDKYCPKSLDHSTQHVPGYFRYLVKEMLILDFLSAEEEITFRNIDSADPQSIVDTIVNVVRKTNASKVNDFYQKDEPKWFQISLRRVITKDPLICCLIVYAFLVFLACYNSYTARKFIVSFHLLLAFAITVYIQTDKEYAALQGKKIATMSMPDNCKEQLSIKGMFYSVKSMFQIGNVCEKYHQQVLVEPWHDLNLLRVIVNTATSVVTVPITSIGKDLSTFFEELLLPFPFHLQLAIMGFLFSLPVCIVLCCRAGSSVTVKQDSSETSELQEEMRQMKLGQQELIKHQELTFHLHEQSMLEITQSFKELSFRMIENQSYSDKSFLNVTIDKELTPSQDEVEVKDFYKEICEVDNTIII